MDNDRNAIFISFDVNEGNFRKFINKLRKKLRRILPVRDGFFVFNGIFHGWCIIELRSNRAKVKVKINSRDFFFHGFQNSRGKWWRLNYPDIDNFGEASVFRYSGSYDELLAKAGGDELYDIDLTRESISHSIYVLSNFNGNLHDQQVPLSMLRMILTICESTRFFPIQASVCRFFRPKPPPEFTLNIPPPRFTVIQATMLKSWDTITSAYFSDVFTYIDHNLDIVSRGDVRKKVAIGIVQSSGLNVGDRAGGDGPDNGKGSSGSRRDGHHKYEKGSASSSTSRSKKKSGSGVKGRKYSHAAYQGKGIDTIALLQPLDFKLTKLQGIYEDCIHPLAWKRSLPNTSWPDSLIINNESRVQLHTVHTYQGHHHKILNHFRGAKEFLFRPEFNLLVPPQAIQFHAAESNYWWWNTSPSSGVLRSFLPVLQQAPTIRIVTTRSSLSHLQLVHLLCVSPVLRDLMRLPIAMSKVPSRSENPGSSSRSSLLKWFNYAKGPAPELPVSSRGIIGGSLIGELSISPTDVGSSFVPHRSWLARMG